MKFSQINLHSTNMKTIIAVILFLTYAFARETSGSCSNQITSMTNLNIEKFFKDTWYMSYIKGGSKEATCREYIFRMEGDLIKLTADGEYTLNGPKKEYSTICSSTSGVPLNPAKPFVLKCRHIVDAKNNIFFELKLSVIETDYSGYALVYRCTSYDAPLNLINGNYLILKRRKDATVSISSNILNQRGLSIKEFTKTAGC